MFDTDDLSIYFPSQEQTPLLILLNPTDMLYNHEDIPLIIDKFDECSVFVGLANQIYGINRTRKHTDEYGMAVIRIIRGIRVPEIRKFTVYNLLFNVYKGSEIENSKLYTVKFPSILTGLAELSPGVTPGIEKGRLR